jgi:hypothetical protein
MKTKYQRQTEDGRTFGEIMHHIGKRTTQQTKKSKKVYSRKERCNYDNWYPDSNV